MPLPRGLPIVDHHCHLSPSGEGVAAAHRFRAAGGTHLFLATQNYEPDVPRSVADYLRQFETTEQLATQIRESTGVVVSNVIAPSRPSAIDCRSSLSPREVDATTFSIRILTNGIPGRGVFKELYKGFAVVRGRISPFAPCVGARSGYGGGTPGGRAQRIPPAKATADNTAPRRAIGSAVSGFEANAAPTIVRTTMGVNTPKIHRTVTFVSLNRGRRTSVRGELGRCSTIREEGSLLAGVPPSE